MNPKSKKKTAKKRSKKGRSRGGLKLLLSAIIIACILLAGAFYLLDVKVKAKSDNALMAKIERFFGGNESSQAPEQKQSLSQKPNFSASSGSKTATKDEQTHAHSRANLTDIKALFDEAEAKNKIKIGGERDKFEGKSAVNFPSEQSEFSKKSTTGSQNKQAKFDANAQNAPKIKDQISPKRAELASQGASDINGSGKFDASKNAEPNSSNLNSKNKPAEFDPESVKFDASKIQQRTHIFANSEAVIFDDMPMSPQPQNQTQNEKLEQALKKEKIHIEFSDAKDESAGQGEVKFGAQSETKDAEAGKGESVQSETQKTEKEKAKKEGKVKFADAQKAAKQGAEVKAAVKAGHKPRLVIIIDDVAYKHQADAIKSVNLKLTPSFFPSTSAHPETPILARRFSFHMIHLPMQALGGFKGAEIGTLTVNDDYEKIVKKLQSIKRDFPNLKYINNHTGSRFTSDAAAMDRLMRAMRDENLIFVDSKTTSPTKVYAAAKKYSMSYIARDVFLDHDGSKAAVRKQLKYAVELAKKRSYAIAIGHPHKNTLEVLQESAKLLQEVEVVYLKDLF